MFRKLSQFFIFPVFILAMFLCLKACHPMPVTDEKEEGFFSWDLFPHTWWDYYKEALLSQEKGDWEAAEIYLREAIRQRGEDQWQARTYGRHFIDYFPNRELGIAYYYLDKWEEARKELELSLTQTPSSKARFYLDQAREALIKNETEKKPELALNFKEWMKDGVMIISGTDEDKKYVKWDSDDIVAWTRSNPVFISGIAKDEQQYVSSITIQNETLLFEDDIAETGNSVKHRPFRKGFLLPVGSHEIKVKATNLRGGNISHKLLIMVDREGPMIILELPLPSKNGIIRGSLYDDIGISKLLIANEKEERKVEIDNNNRFFFDTKLLSEIENANLIAIDQLGNKTELSLSSFSATAAPNLFASLSNRLFVRNSSVVSIKTDLYNNQIVYQSFIVPKIEIIVNAIPHEALSISVTGKREIKGWKIEGRENNKIIKCYPEIELEEGENHITIQVKGGGKILPNGEKIIKIIKKTAKVYDTTERLKILIFPPVYCLSDSCENGHMYIDIFQKTLKDKIIENKRFVPYDYEEILNFAESEEKIIVTKNKDRVIEVQYKVAKEKAMKIGREWKNDDDQRADCIIFGMIKDDRKNKKIIGYEVIAEMIDLEEDYRMMTIQKDMYENNLELCALKMENRFRMEFPYVGGTVIKKDDNSNRITSDFTQPPTTKDILFDIASRYKLHPCDKIIVFKEDICGYASLSKILPPEKTPVTALLKTCDIKEIKENEHFVINK